MQAQTTSRCGGSSRRQRQCKTQRWKIRKLFVDRQRCGLRHAYCAAGPEARGRHGLQLWCGGRRIACSRRRQRGWFERCMCIHGPNPRQADRGSVGETNSFHRMCHDKNLHTARVHDGVAAASNCHPAPPPAPLQAGAPAKAAAIISAAAANPVTVADAALCGGGRHTRIKVDRPGNAARNDCISPEDHWILFLRSDLVCEIDLILGANKICFRCRV